MGVLCFERTKLLATCYLCLGHLDSERTLQSVKVDRLPTTKTCKLAYWWNDVCIIACMGMHVGNGECVGQRYWRATATVGVFIVACCG